MNTPSFDLFFYLLDDTDLHDRACCCNPPQPLPHRATVARLYKLDGRGLQALEADLHLDDYEGSFDQWLDDHRRHAQTSYGSDEQAARASALQQARKEGKLVINYPEAFPWIFPVASALLGVVGSDVFEINGCLAPDVCKCNSMHTREQTVCRACYARLVCNILYRFVYAHLRERQREGVSQ
jgi:hypothetical protein